MAGKLYLIGYRGLRHAQFFGLLNQAGCGALLDVRRNPYSPNPDYQKAAIEAEAPSYGVRYHHVPEIGVPGAGKSPIPAGAPATFEEQMATPEAQRALRRIIKSIEADRSVALMCSEPNFRDCHRRHLVTMLEELKPDLQVESLTAVGEQRLF